MIKIVPITIILLISPSLLNIGYVLAENDDRIIESNSYSSIQKTAETTEPPYDGISDPNEILNQKERQNLADRLKSFYLLLSTEGLDRTVIAPTTRNNENQGDGRVDHTQSDAEYGDTRFPIQFAVAIVEELGTMSVCHDEDRDDCIEKIAGEFATSLHDEWGVGHEIPNDEGDKNGGGTGVLIFLDVRDRVVFISVGGALRHLLTNGRIDRIIKKMRPDLKRAAYGLGLLGCIDAIIEILEKGEEPSGFERICDELFKNYIFVTLMWTLFVLGYEQFQSWGRHREQRRYAEAAARLSELDRAQAEALRGSYNQATSCPICLEDFIAKEVGSDGHPIQLLRCGHVFDKTCYDDWMQLGHGDVSKCPVCRADVGSSSSYLSVHSRTAENPRATTNALNSLSASTIERNGGNESDLQQSVNLNDDDDDDDGVVLTDNGSNEIINSALNDYVNHGNAVVRYRQDRNFRLERLSQLYPRYISIDYVTRWTSPSFNGSLARDAAFRSNNPDVVHGANQRRSASWGHENGFGNERSGGGSYNFGGGTSGGGRAGRF